MKNIYEEIWNKLKQKSSQRVVIIKQGEKEMLIDKENKLFAVKCKAGDLKK